MQHNDRPVFCQKHLQIGRGNHPHKLWKLLKAPLGTHKVRLSLEPFT
jgi:hypothetical protein